MIDLSDYLKGIFIMEHKDFEISVLGEYCSSTDSRKQMIIESYNNLGETLERISAILKAGIDVAIEVNTWFTTDKEE